MDDRSRFSPPLLCRRTGSSNSDGGGLSRVAVVSVASVSSDGMLHWMLMLRVTTVGLRLALLLLTGMRLLLLFMAGRLLPVVGVQVVLGVRLLLRLTGIRLVLLMGVLERELLDCMVGVFVRLPSMFGDLDRRPPFSVRTADATPRHAARVWVRLRAAAETSLHIASKQSQPCAHVHAHVMA